MEFCFLVHLLLWRMFFIHLKWTSHHTPNQDGNHTDKILRLLYIIPYAMCILLHKDILQHNYRHHKFHRVLSASMYHTQILHTICFLHSHKFFHQSTFDDHEVPNYIHKQYISFESFLVRKHLHKKNILLFVLHTRNFQHNTRYRHSY